MFRTEKTRYIGQCIPLLMGNTSPSVRKNITRFTDYYFPGGAEYEISHTPKCIKSKKEESSWTELKHAEIISGTYRSGSRVNGELVYMILTLTDSERKKGVNIWKNGHNTTKRGGISTAKRGKIDYIEDPYLKQKKALVFKDEAMDKSVLIWYSHISSDPSNAPETKQWWDYDLKTKEGELYSRYMGSAVPNFDPRQEKPIDEFVKTHLNSPNFSVMDAKNFRQNAPKRYKQYSKDGFHLVGALQFDQGRMGHYRNDNGSDTTIFFVKEEPIIIKVDSRGTPIPKTTHRVRKTDGEIANNAGSVLDLNSLF